MTQFEKQTQENWEIVDALWGGTSEMRKHQKFLPKKPREDGIEYYNRLRRTFLVNEFKNTIKKIVARPFSVPMAVEVPDYLQDFVDRPTYFENTLEKLAKKHFQTALKYGSSHILVDAPKDASFVGPKAVHYSPTAIHSWEFASRGDEVRLASISFKELDSNNEEYLRTITDNEYFLVKNDEIIEQGTHDFGRIPLVSLFLDLDKKNMAFDTEPPFLDLAHLNIAHYQSTSDQRTALEFARIGILHLSGADSEEEDQIKSVGPSRLISTTNPNSVLKYVEHSGAAMKIGQEDILHLERQMQALGSQPYIEKVATTATGKEIDEKRAVTIAQQWAIELQESLIQILYTASEWLTDKEPEEIKVSIHTKFDGATISDSNKSTVLALASGGYLTPEEVVYEMRRYGVLSEQTKGTGNTE